MRFSVAISLCLGLVVNSPLAAAYVVKPPSEAASDTATGCNVWWVAQEGDGFAHIAALSDISVEMFESLNPSIKLDGEIVSGLSYCVKATTLEIVSPTSTVASKPSHVQLKRVVTPSPVASGIAPTCVGFHKVVNGDTCDTITQAQGITRNDFYRWNPDVGINCTRLRYFYYYCVAIPGTPAVTTTTTTTSTTSTTTTDPVITTDPMTTTTGNGISTPKPVQTGMATNCDRFYNVKRGDQCGAIASTASIPLPTFYMWNPAIGDVCQGLQYGYNVCTHTVGFIGEPPTPTTTKPGNGIVTPTPVQTGMVPSCNKFYKVKSGDQCDGIAMANSITSAAFLSWNPAVGANCESLWLSYNVCVGVVGGSGTLPPTTTSTTTTAPGNGIATPTPVQPGMVSSCNKFYKIKPGDQCDTIAIANSITSAAFSSWNPAVGANCESLWLGYNVCVGVIGGSGTVPPTPTTTRPPSNGIATPTPVQPNMVSSCNKFYKVKAGDRCDAIAKANSVTSDAFLGWNPAVGKNCESLWLGYNVCIGVVGGSGTVPPTTTKPGNGVATPTPTQTGMVSNCKTFHRVVNGDGCQKIADQAGVSLNTFYSWNRGLGADCGSLWLGYYVCIAVL